MKRNYFAGPHSVCTPHSNEQLKLNIKCHNLCGNLNEVKNQYASVLTRKIIMQRKHLVCLLEWRWTLTECCQGEEGPSIRNLCTQKRVNYTPFRSLSDPSSLLYAAETKLLPLRTACESAGSRCTSWSAEQRVSQGFKLLMAEILANVKAALGLSLVLAEVNAASSPLHCQGRQEGQLG